MSLAPHHHWPKFQKMRYFLILISLATFSCVSPQLAERKPIPPKGSDEAGSQPWNIPQSGEGAGALGGLLERR